jgi:hypothetical protein
MKLNYPLTIIADTSSTISISEQRQRLGTLFSKLFMTPTPFKEQDIFFHDLHHNGLDFHILNETLINSSQTQYQQDLVKKSTKPIEYYIDLAQKLGNDQIGTSLYLLQKYKHNNLDTLASLVKKIQSTGSLHLISPEEFSQVLEKLINGKKDEALVLFKTRASSKFNKMMPKGYIEASHIVGSSWCDSFYQSVARKFPYKIKQLVLFAPDRIEEELKHVFMPSKWDVIQRSAEKVRSLPWRQQIGVLTSLFRPHPVKVSSRSADQVLMKDVFGDFDQFFNFATYYNLLLQKRISNGRDNNAKAGAKVLDEMDKLGCSTKEVLRKLAENFLSNLDIEQELASLTKNKNS